MQKQQERNRYYYREHRMAFITLILITGLYFLVPVLEDIPSVFSEYEGKKVTICGMVRESREGNAYLWLQADNTKEVLYTQLPRTWADEEKLIWYPAGSRLEIVGIIEKPAEKRNPGGFDEASWFLSKKAKMKLNAEEIRVIEQPQSIWKLSWKVQCSIKETAKHYLTEEQNALALGLLLGNKQQMDQSFYRMTQRMGIAHVFAVSGLHAGVIGALLLFVFRAFRKEHSWISFLILSVGLGFYCIVTGLAPSAIRAALMMVLAALSLRLLRSPAPIDFLAMAAIILLMDNPFLLYNAGFQLSLGVTLSLLLFARPVEKKLCFIKWRWLRESVAVTLTASFGSIPFSAWHFYSVSLLAPLYNLLLVPLVSVLVPLLLIILPVTVVFPFTHTLFIFPVKILLNLLLWGTAFLNDVFGTGHYYTGRPDWITLVFYLLFLYFLWNWLMFEQKKSVKSLNWKMQLRNNSVIFLILAVTSSFFKVSCGNELLYLDTGQGSCALLRTEAGETVIFDGGAQPRELASVLAWHGINEVNAIVLSHGDDDHTGGLLQVLEAVKVEYLCIEKMQAQREEVKLLLEAAEAGGTKIKPVETDARLMLADGEIVLKAVNDGRGETNSRELAAVLHLAEQVAVFPGDLGIEGILQVVEHQNSITIWTVPHHGSRFSANAELYKRLKEKGTQVAVISAGRNNRYGHPHAEVLEYLSSNQINLCRTDLDGAVYINLNEIENAE